MRTWLLSIWDATRSSFWFVPSIFLIGSVVTAIIFIEVDSSITVQKNLDYSWLTTTATSARSMLSTLAGALVTVTGVVFSITMLTLAQTSSQYGSRLLRSILDDNVTQMTLGVFLGTSAFCFVVLRNVREFSDGDHHQPFIPHIATAAALVGGGVCLVVFIYFVHSVSRSIQAQSIVEAVGQELNDAIHRLYPQQIGEPEPPERTALEGSQILADPTVIHADRYGYLQSVNAESLLAIAHRSDVVLQSLCYPGQFVDTGMPLCQVLAGDESPLSDAGLTELRRCFILGNQRTPRQDVECPINELVEVAVRALSPGINDPFTAFACLDYLGNGLQLLVQRKAPNSERFDGQGTLRLVLKTNSKVSAIDAAFLQIRHYSKDSPAVLARMIDALTIVARVAQEDDIRHALQRHCDMILRTAQQNIAEHYDRDDIASRAEDFRTVLAQRGCNDSANG